MKRPWVLGLIGLIAVLVAVGLNFWLDRSGTDDSETMRPTVTAAAPVSPRPEPIMPAPEASPAPGTPGFDLVRVSPNGDAVIAGHAAPDSSVTVHDGDRVVGNATADRGGDWVLVPGEPLGAGSRELSLSARVGEGPAVSSDQSVVIVVPDGRGAKITPDDTALALLVPREGNGPSTLLQAPGTRATVAPSPATRLDPPAAGPAGNNVTLDVIDYGETGKVELAGRAPPGTALRVYLDNQLIGEASANADGRWQLEPQAAIDPGLYHLRVDEIAPGGRVVQRIELPFSRAAMTADMLATDRLIVQPGNSLWRIARRAYGVGLRYSVIYKANQEQIRDPDLIYPGQILSVPTAN